MELEIRNKIDYENYLNSLDAVQERSSVMKKSDELLFQQGKQFLEMKLREFLRGFPCKTVIVELRGSPANWRVKIIKVCFWAWPLLWSKLRKFKAFLDKRLEDS